MKCPNLFLLVALGMASAPDIFCVRADSVAAPETATNQLAYAPAVLPGKGLAQHDFFYSGEAKDERLFHRLVSSWLPDSSLRIQYLPPFPQPSAQISLNYLFPE